jgi:hypothetical protein
MSNTKVDELVKKSNFPIYLDSRLRGNDNEPPHSPASGISAMIPADKSALLRQAAGYSGEGE